MGDGDEWPAIRQRIVTSEILVLASPTWLGKPSSVAQRWSGPFAREKLHLAPVPPARCRPLASVRTADDHDDRHQGGQTDRHEHRRAKVHGLFEDNEPDACKRAERGSESTSGHAVRNPSDATRLRATDGRGASPTNRSRRQGVRGVSPEGERSWATGALLGGPRTRSSRPASTAARTMGSRPTSASACASSSARTSSLRRLPPWRRASSSPARAR